MGAEHSHWEECVCVSDCFCQDNAGTERGPVDMSCSEPQEGSPDMGEITLPYMEGVKENLRPSPCIYEREGANLGGKRLGAGGSRSPTAQESRSAAGGRKKPEEGDPRPSRYLIFDRSRFSNCVGGVGRPKEERMSGSER